MKKLIYMFLAGTIAMGFSACGGSTGDLKSQNDSLMAVNSQQGQILDNLTETLYEVSASLDSITIEENTLKSQMKEGAGISKKEMLENLNHFKQMLAENKARMTELENQLSKRDDQLAKLSKLVKYLTEEIQNKEAIIADLQEQLSQKNADISSLRSQVSNLNTTVVNLEQENAEHQEALKNAGNALNTVYYKIGTKKELSEKGILTGGGLTKKKLNTSNINLDLFVKEDGRNLNTISVNSKKPQLLPEPPAASYKVETNGSKSVITITDPDKFWSLSKVLVIRVD